MLVRKKEEKEGGGKGRLTTKGKKSQKGGGGKIVKKRTIVMDWERGKRRASLAKGKPRVIRGKRKSCDGGVRQKKC